VQKNKPNNAFAHLAAGGVAAMRNASGHGMQKLAAAGGMSEFMTRASAMVSIKSPRIVRTG